MADNSDTMSNYRRQLILPSDHSFFLFGPRGTGKSTLLEEWRKKTLLKKVRPDQVLSLDLLDPETEARLSFAPATLKQEIEALPHLPEWVLIDEVQKVPAILDVVHELIEKRKIKFALTGSSARKLKRNAANLLGGRAFSFHLHPLTHSELGKDFDLAEALRWGTLPKLGTLSDPLSKKRYLQSYVHTYLKEEIQLEQIVRNIDRFRQFLPLAGQLAGEPLQFSKTSHLSGVDEKSVARYFEILADTLVGFFLEPYERSIRKRQSQKPKFFLFDTGVLRAIQGRLEEPLKEGSSVFGRVFESFILTEFVRVNDYLEKDFRFSYLRTRDGVEIDLIVERGSRPPVLIEIKSTDHPTVEDERHLASVAKDFPNSEQIILCRATRARKSENGVLILPWKNAFEQIFEV